MREVGAVIDTLGNVLHWHEPDGSSIGSLPDSRSLWDIIWETHQQKRFAGFAHTHPGSGWPGPSGTDLTTFRAIERALGVKPLWWIASSDHLVVMRRIVVADPDNHDGAADSYVIYNIDPVFGEVVLAPWAAELRRRSNY